jgi:hypothetical protein
VSFDPRKLRLERFKIDLHYHAAFDFWSFKGALAEKWGHGPVFGTFVDQGNQVKLAPEQGFSDDRVEATYGVRFASFDRELVKDKEGTYRLARQWLADVVEVLDPKKTNRIAAQWFVLHHLGNADAAASANQKLRLRYYNKEKLDAFWPDYGQRFAAVDGMCIDGNRHWSAIMGIVGPHHKNHFFGVPDEERDRQWWMGINFNLSRIGDEDDCLVSGSPMALVDELFAEGDKEYERLVNGFLASVV